MILDTNAITALLEGDKRLGKLLGSAEYHHLPLNVTAEYLYGLRSLRKGSKLPSLFRKLEAKSDTLIPDRGTADWYAAIRHALRLKGTPIPESDLWTAALAKQYELKIVSQDHHFGLIDGIQRLGW